MGINNVNKLSFEQDIKSEDYTYIMEYVLTLTFKKSSSRARVMAVVNFTIVLLFQLLKICQYIPGLFGTKVVFHELVFAM